MYCSIFNRGSALFCLPCLGLIEHTNTHSDRHTPKITLPHLKIIDLFCLEFCSSFFSLPQWLFTAMFAAIFFLYVPVVREAHRAGCQNSRRVIQRLLKLPGEVLGVHTPLPTNSGLYLEFQSHHSKTYISYPPHNVSQSNSCIQHNTRYTCGGIGARMV